jgi:hypothetical protein
MTRLELLAALEDEVSRPIPPPPKRPSPTREAALQDRVKELQAQNRKLSKAMAAQRRSHQQAKERLESRIAELEQRALNHRCGYLGRVVP